MRRLLSAICMLCGCTYFANAEVRLPKFFSNNMVLQQQTECNIWGTAEAGKTVAVKTSWDNKTYKVKAADNGSFEIKVVTPEAGGPYDITFDDGTVLYSRKAPSGKPCESELGTLSEGIAFSDYSSAISAIYDLVS